MLMLVLLRRRMGGLAGEGLWRTLLMAVPISALMGAAVHVVVMGVSSIVPVGTVGETLVVAAAGLVGIGVYGTVGFLVGMEEIHLLRRTVTG
jgi:hypothetical protein